MATLRLDPLSQGLMAQHAIQNASISPEGCNAGGIPLQDCSIEATHVAHGANGESAIHLSI